MSITKERFAQGMSFQQYLDQMTRNRERLEENYNTVQLSDEQLAFFKHLPQPLNVVVIAEDWCGDGSTTCLCSRAWPRPAAS